MKVINFLDLQFYDYRYKTDTISGIDKTILICVNIAESSSPFTPTGVNWRGLLYRKAHLMATQRLVLFIDAQNFYNGARRAFFADSDPHFYGQTKPMELGNLICSRRLPGHKAKLKEVRVYTGRPDSTKEPNTYAAHLKQCNIWDQAGVNVITRTLRYPKDWPTSKAVQKGVDVAIAIDFVALAIDEEYDLGVMASTDSDLTPALEFVRRRYRATRRIEVTAWTSPRTKSRLSIPGNNIWCNWLDLADYESIADLTDYNI